MITGKSELWRRRRSTSMPSMRGIFTSRMARSGGSASSAASPETPSKKDFTAWPWLSRASETEVTMFSSSSTRVILAMSSSGTGSGDAPSWSGS